MQKLNFGGIQGTVIALSPHNSYFLVKLSERAVIRGIYTKDFVWDETTDNVKGFHPNLFTLYLAVRSTIEAKLLKKTLILAGGKPDEELRQPRYLKDSPYEMRIIGLSAESIVQIVSDLTPQLQQQQQQQD
ncbi:hypothetical protein [Microcoleus sp. BROC3]|uniref:hypothetical protein n=1 Tax=Microcoleus sp. BROC3 TaxID=3055323 RepID=UPI002FCEE723